MTEQLTQKVAQAIKLLQTIAKAKNNIELAYSGGKDSDVILELARMAGIPFTPIYKNTTIDPPGTIKHCMDNGVEIRRPRKTFFQLIEYAGFPTRFKRFCCSQLKEYKIKDTCIIGIRREESSARAAMYKEPTRCRIYSRKEHVEQILPILDWTTADVEEFIIEHGIRLHPLYYNADGSINCKKRLGCMGCPLQSDRGLQQFKDNPRLVRAWLRAGKKWWDTHPNRKLTTLFSDVYELFAINIFVGDKRKAILNKEALIPTDYKQALENYFHIELP